ncbi:MAG TPA: hypothetical protein VMB78_11640, partial [Dissulfurispiraceae bacterium]|nr:hypothetical protein [Dissulfurispiraceae bacterium]
MASNQATIRLFFRFLSPILLNPLIAVLMSASLFFVAGCAKEPDVKYPNAITLGSGADAKRLLPFLASDSASGQISGYIFNGLTKYDKDLNITGDLAESWDVSADGL